MVDLGHFNFVQRQIAEGKSKEEIAQSLAKSGLSPEHIEDIWNAVTHNKVPKTSSPREPLRASYTTNTSLGILAVLLVIIAGYFAITGFLKATSTSSVTLPSSAQAVNGISYYPYNEPEIGITMSVPADWVVAKHSAPDGTVDGFTVSEQLGSDTLTAQITEQQSTQLLSGIVTERGSELQGQSAIHIIQNKDVTIGGEPGHIFEYTTATSGKTVHSLQAFVLNKAGNHYQFLAQSPDGDWSQMPAVVLVNSISFGN